MGDPATEQAEEAATSEATGAVAMRDYSAETYLDRRNSKQVRDNVHGYIYLDSMSLRFVDTEQFQRLRDLKQLGLTHMVYPGAVHSRFEHSLGVYSLAGEAIHRIKAQQGMELGIENIDVKMVKLAGLLHDIGHGPFSHLFEHEVLPRVRKGIKWSHEDMSLSMIDYIVDTHHIDIDSDVLKKVKDMVVASTERGAETIKSMNEKRFLYDIVANSRNGIDVDKFDYIVRDTRACGLGCSFQFERLLDTMRVIGDEICYRGKDYLTVYELFATRANLHRSVYRHAKVKAIEYMVVDALSMADDHLQLSSSVEDPSEFWKMDDSILKTIETSTEQELKEARDLIQRIRRRDLYQYCNQFPVPDTNPSLKVTPQDIICCQPSGSQTSLTEDDIIVSTVKIDLTRGKDNPLQSVKFYKDYETNDKFPIADDQVSHLLPATYQDEIVSVYAKNADKVQAVSDAFEEFQRQKFGESKQVHSTPGKKLRRTRLNFT